MSLKFIPYSYSKIETYNMCAYKFKLNYIDKISVFTENKALEKGSRIHEIIEFYEPTNYWKMKPYDYKLLDENEQKDCEDIALKFCKSELGNKYLMHRGVIGHEIKMGLDKKLQPCNYFSDDAILRGKIDFTIKEGNKVIVADWKSGKVKEQAYMSNDQVMLYAIWAFNMFSDIDEVQADYVYVEHNEIHSFNFKRENYKNFSQNYAQKIKKIESDEEFKKKPQRLCEWCDYLKQGFCNGKEE